jgi:hypothetical protein
MSNKIKYQMFCSNCKNITPHFIIDNNQNMEPSKIKNVHLTFFNDLFNFLSNTPTSMNNVDSTEYICSICNNKYLDIY